MGVIFNDTELQVIRLTASGDSAKAIAAKMRLPLGTITHIRTVVFIKMGAKNAAHMVSLAYKNDILP